MNPSTVNFKRIVVAVDGTPAAVHALREAAVIATAAGAQLMVLTVVEDPWRHVEPREVEGFRRRHGTTPADLAETRVRAGVEALVASTIGTGAAKVVVQFGVPGIELARWTEEAGADLLVIGRQPWGDLARRPAGRTVAGTLARARVPCLLVPFGQRTWRRVLAAIGSGPAAEAVENAAAAFAGLWHAAPRRVHVESHATARAPSCGCACGEDAPVAVAVSDDPVGEVLRTAREFGADTLVVGYHRGETAAEAGRTAPLLLERAPCAVLTVPV